MCSFLWALMPLYMWKYDSGGKSVTGENVVTAGRSTYLHHRCWWKRHHRGKQ